MPVYKYRRIEDMPETWQHHGDRNIGGRLRTILAMARLAGPLQMPRGVRKFRSFEELAEDREQRESERIARIRAKHAR
jgi:hypothetical protein